MGGGRLINLEKLCLCTTSSDLKPRNVVRHAKWLTTYVSLVISTLPYAPVKASFLVLLVLQVGEKMQRSGQHSD